MTTKEQMLELIDKLREEFDYILLDCPAGIEQGFQNAIAGADRALIVTTPEVSAIRDADRIIGLLEANEIRKIDLIVNSPVGKDSVNDDSYLRKAAIKAKIPYMTTIAAARATASGIGYVKSHKTSEIKSLQQLHSEIHDKEA